MSQTSPPASDKKPTGTPQAPLVPPDEQFWQRYSPHNEFPLSTVTSVALHILAVVLILVTAWVIAVLQLKDERSLPVEAVTMAGGSGGNPRGVGSGPGDGDLPELGATEQEPPDKKKPLPSINFKDVDLGALDPVELPKIVNDKGERLFNPASKAIQALSKLDEKVRRDISKGVVAGEGKAGRGSGGGEGSGVGGGEGAGVGDGTGKISRRQQRVLRWTLVFNTNDGRDYANQLSALGAIVAYPDPGNPQQYLVIRDLTRRPVQGQAEDLSGIKRIFWIDDKPQSVASLARAIGLPGVPHIVAFFPEELESRLLKLELDWMRSKTGKADEDRIEETRFEVRRTATGYEPYVVEQRLH
jgi:hypothetical protein